MMNFVFRFIATLSVALLVVSPVSSQAEDTPRLLVVISDLHLGIGHDISGKWDPTEDFRWYKALKGFLDHISRKGNDHVDLVIAGDFLELWQPPAGIACRGKGTDLGCSISEIKQIVDSVIGAHSNDLAAIAAFARQGSNHVYVMAGNHDAAIVIPKVWALLAKKLEADKGRVTLVKDGIWSSNDGQILIEHGHQIGSDANRFYDWPQVTLPGDDGQDYLVRTWGELFVQRFFNKEEKTYPIIDNLSPESAGLKYRMADKGKWGSTVDIARFVAFNLFQTSQRQKIAVLGPSSALGRPKEICTADEGRALGYRLFVNALPENDPLLNQIEAKTDEAKKLRAELDAFAQRLSEEDIANLCALPSKTTPTLGRIAERSFIPRYEVLRKHLDTRLKKYPNTSVFIYGHTHQFEEPWQVTIESDHPDVTVVNSGAFQRLIEESGYIARVEREKQKPWEGLRKIGLNNLAPCYSAVFVKYKQKMLSADVKLWYMPEEGTGDELSPGASKCQ